MDQDKNQPINDTPAQVPVTQTPGPVPTTEPVNSSTSDFSTTHYVQFALAFVAAIICVIIIAIVIHR